MDEPLHTFRVEKLTVEIHPDIHAELECPLEDQFDGGDYILVVSFGTRSVLKNYHPFDTPEDALAYAKEHEYVVYGLYRYEHGAVLYRAGTENPFSCQWDSGQDGFVFLNKKRLEEIRSDIRSDGFYDKPDEELINLRMQGLTNWANGYAWGFKIVDDDGEELDSCWGYDDEDHCIEEAKSCASYQWSNVVKRLDEEATQFARELERSRPDMYGHVG